MAFLRAITETKSWSSFALILLSLFCWWKWYPSHGFPRSIHLHDGFSKTEYLDPCIIWPSLCFDEVNIREISLQAWLWLPFRMFSPKYFCPNNQHFAQKNSEIGGCSYLLAAPCLLRPIHLWSRVSTEGVDQHSIVDAFSTHDSYGFSPVWIWHFYSFFTGNKNFQNSFFILSHGKEQSSIISLKINQEIVKWHSICTLYIAVEIHTVCS